MDTNQATYCTHQKATSCRKHPRHGPCVPRPVRGVTVTGLDFKITEGDFLAKRQTWIIFPANTSIDRRDFLNEALGDKKLICPHINFWQHVDRRNVGFVGHKIYITMRIGRPYTCRYCETGYQLNHMNISDHLHAMCITRWANLGSFSTSNDAQWRRHCGWNDGGQSFRDSPIMESYRNPREMFEGTEWLAKFDFAEHMTKERRL